MSGSEGALAPPDGIVPNFQHPQDVLHTINTVSEILVIAIIAPFVLLRIYIRAYVTASFSREDWCCIIAWLLSTGYCLTGLFMGFHGGGHNQWEVTKNELVGFKQALYADTIVYGPTAWFTKSSLLLMFIRIFYVYKKTVFFIYCFMGAMLLYYFPVMVMKIKICTPIAGLWDPNIQASCINQAALFKTDTIMSAVTDFVILVLPIPLVSKLNMPLNKKLRIGVLLGAGGIATLASIVRLILVFQPNSFFNETVSFVRFNLLGVAEVGIGMVCACVPAIHSYVTMRYSKQNHQEETPSPNKPRTKEGYSVNRFKRRLHRSNIDTDLTGRMSRKPETSYVEVGSVNDVLLSNLSTATTASQGQGSRKEQKVDVLISNLSTASTASQGRGPRREQKTDVLISNLSTASTASQGRGPRGEQKADVLISNLSTASTNSQGPRVGERRDVLLSNLSSIPTNSQGPQPEPESETGPDGEAKKEFLTHGCTCHNITAESPPWTHHHTLSDGSTLWSHGTIDLDDIGKAV